MALEMANFRFLLFFFISIINSLEFKWNFLFDFIYNTKYYTCYTLMLTKLNDFFSFLLLIFVIF